MTPHPASTRTSYRRGHALFTPDTFIRAPLPAIVHAAPAMGVAFTQYTAELESGGGLGPAAALGVDLRGETIFPLDLK